MIEIKEISKIYGTLPQQVYALDHVNLKIQEGEVATYWNYCLNAEKNMSRHWL